MADELGSPVLGGEKCGGATSGKRDNCGERGCGQDWLLVGCSRVGKALCLSEWSGKRNE